MKKLTRKQERFVNALMGPAEGVAVRAAEMAGYQGGGSALRSVASRLQRHPGVVAAIEKIAESDPLVMERKELQVWWSSVIRGDEDAMKDKIKASDLLAKSQGLFIKKIEIEDGPKRIEQTREERLNRIRELEELHMVHGMVKASEAVCIKCKCKIEGGE